MLFDLHEKMFGVSHHSSKIRDFRLRVGSIAAAVFMVLWIIASTVVSAVFTVRYMGIVEDGMGTRGRHTRPWEDGRRFPGFHGARKTKRGIYWKALHGQLQQKLNQLWRLRHRWEKLGRSQDTCWPTRCWVEPTLIFTGEICLDLRHRLWSHQNQLWLCCNWKHSGAHHGLVARSHQWNDIMISWYQRPNIYAWHAKKKLCQGPRSSKHPSKSCTEETLRAFLRYGLHWPHCGS